MSINSRLRILQFKWLMRSYTTPVKLNKYNRNIPDICIKCGLKDSWYIVCGNVVKYKYIEKILSKQLTLDSKLFIRALYPEKHKFTKTVSSFINFTSLIAKRCIALNWKNINGPSASQWLKQMLSSLPLERIMYICKLKQHVFERIWGPFIEFVKDLDLSDDLTDFWVPCTTT